MKFIIYTTKDASYIVPDEKAKLPKKFEHSYEIECGVEICDKKIKLPQKITKIEQVSGMIARLQYTLKQDEIDALKKDLNL
jgi:hypothetical protein